MAPSPLAACAQHVQVNQLDGMRGRGAAGKAAGWQVEEEETRFELTSASSVVYSRETGC